MNFEEVKQLVLESIDESNNMNELIHIVVNKIYQKGIMDEKSRAFKVGEILRVKNLLYYRKEDQGA